MKIIAIVAIVLHAAGALILYRGGGPLSEAENGKTDRLLYESVADKLGSIDPRELLLKLKTVPSRVPKAHRNMKEAMQRIGKDNVFKANTQGAIINNIAKKFRKSNQTKARRYKKTFKRIQRLLGKPGFRSWKRKLSKSGITVSKLPLEVLNRFATRFAVQNRRAPRMLPLGMHNNDHSLLSYNIKKMSGGSLSVRFPDLPRAIVVNQTPYYQYT